MKVLLLPVLFFAQVLSAQTLQWKWARGGGGVANDTGQTIAIDAKRNHLYVAGNYSSPTMSIGTQTLVNNGLSDFFVAKYDTGGTLLWAKSFGGANSDWVNGIDCDSLSGAVYVCGTYDQATQLGASGLVAPGKNFFLCKLDANGTVQWVKSGTNRGLSGAVDDYGNDVSVLSNGDIVMAGIYNGGPGDTLVIDNFKLLYAPFTNPAGAAGGRLLVKLNTSGTVLNAVLGGGVEFISETSLYNRNRILSMERDHQDNLYIAFNKTGTAVNAGIDCGGLLPQPSTAGYHRNFTVFQFNSSLVQTNRYCRQLLPPNRPGCTVVTGYSTEMTDMARDVNGNIFVGFNYIIYEGPGPLATCESQGTGIKRIVVPGNTGVSNEKFNTPAGKFTAFNNLLFFQQGGISILYDYELQNTVSTLPTPVTAQDLAVLPALPKVFITGSYFSGATIGPDVLPNLPGENFVLAGQQISCAVPPPVPVISAGGPTTFCSGGSVTLTAPPGSGYAWSNGAATQGITVNTQGVYSVTVINANGCAATSAPVTVAVLSPPPLPVITTSGPLSFCQGGSVTLTAPAGFTYLWSNGAATQSIHVSTSGNYSVTVRNANNCSSTSAATTVTVNPLPPVPVITQSGNTLFSSAATGNQWYFNGAVIPGATGSSYTYSTGGEFTVTVTNASGCTAVSTPYLAPRRAVIDLGNNDLFSYDIFPNPVTGAELTIRYQLSNPHQVGIRLVDMNGHSILLQQPVLQQAGTYTIRADERAARLWKGMYIVEFAIDGKKQTHKLLKLY